MLTFLFAIIVFMIFVFSIMYLFKVFFLLPYAIKAVYKYLTDEDYRKLYLKENNNQKMFLFY